MLGLARKALRNRLEASGYYLQPRHGLPFGLDYMLDIERLAQAWQFPINTFFDVGANIGDSSVEALTRFPGASVVAFEPSTKTFASLVKRIGDNKRFTAHQIALSDKEGEAAFFEYGSAHFNNSLIPNAPHFEYPDKAERRTTVQCRTIDAFCAEHRFDRIDVLKTDAERCDLQVLQGATKTLPQTRFVYFEFNNAVPRAGIQETTLCEVANFIAPFGFRLVATYVDRIDTAPEMFLVANALFVRHQNP